MNEALIIVCTLAICFSLIALILSCAAIAMVVGLKNSTHTIQWKTLDNPHENTDYGMDDPLNTEDEDLPLENPLKRKKKLEKPPEDHEFMEDVLDQNNF